MDAETLMLDSDMPQRINSELKRLGFDEIPDVAGNEPKFARTIFESLALRYASALGNLEKMLGRKLERIHMIGGATRNKLLIELTERQTGLKVEIGETESSTVGNLAAQLAASEAEGGRVTQARSRVGDEAVPAAGVIQKNRSQNSADPGLRIETWGTPSSGEFAAKTV